MFAIALSASGDTPAFWRLVDRAAVFEDEGSVRALNYPAHVSLALYDAIDPAQLTAAVEHFAAEPPLVLCFHRIATFDVERLVLWLAPVLDERLMAFHIAIHASIGPERSMPYYRRDAWVPHCTLATDIAPRRREAALAFARTPIEPIDIALDRIDAIKFPPVDILSSVRLAGPPSPPPAA